MQQDVPDADKAARIIAENVYYAFRGQGTTLIDPSKEQAFLSCLVEAIRPAVGTSVDAIITAANTALSSWEMSSDEAPGSRIATVNLTDGSVSMEPR